MTPEQLSRDAVRVVDQVERRALRRIFALLDVIDADLRDLIAGLDLKDTTTRTRVFRELRARQAVAQSKAARDLLSMGRADGPIAVDFRAGIRESMQDGVASATRAAAATGVVSQAEAAAAVAFGARIDLPLLAALTETTITTLDRVSQDGVQRLTDEIARGAIRGDGPRATARRARAAVDLTRYEAERIVRTVFMRANNQARDDQFARLGVEYVQADATNDDRTCAYCAARHGMVYKRTRAPQFPIHPHCLVGDTHVLAEGVTGYSKRWYEGPVVTITTSAGDRLTVTPNHPILTPDGWVNAGALNVGGHVVAHRLGERVGTARLDDEHVEGPVEQVVDALGESPKMAARPVPVSAEHFHGDGLGSEVAVVGTDGELWDAHDAAVEQHRVQSLFIATVELPLSLLGLSGFQLAPQRDWATTNGLVRLSHSLRSLALVQRAPLLPFGIGLRPCGHPMTPEAFDDASVPGAEAIGDRLGAFPTFVPGRDGGHVERSGADAHPTFLEDGADVGLAADVVGGDLGGALTGEVAIDDVVSVQRSAFAGHVYNLQTRQGWYVADGIVTHNCRCVLLPWREDSEPANRGDAYYERTRADLATKLEAEGRTRTTATASAPFERMDGTPPPRPVWAPGRGFV